MRSLIDLIEASVAHETKPRLSGASARAILSHLEAARGQIAEVVRRNPWLVGLSQEAARARLPARFPVYRAVTATTGLRADTIASTSLDWRVPLQILDEAPGMIWHGNRTVSPRKVLLRYEIAAEQIVLWIPEAMHFVRDALGDVPRGSVPDRHGGRTAIAAILADFETRQEQEVVADLTGLTPRVLDVDGSVVGAERLSVFRAVMDGSIGSDIARWRRDQHIRLLDDAEVADLAAAYALWVP